MATIPQLKIGEPLINLKLIDDTKQPPPPNHLLETSELIMVIIYSYNKVTLNVPHLVAVDYRQFYFNC